MSEAEEIEQIKMELLRLQNVVGTLISWLSLDLGEDNARDLIDRIDVYTRYPVNDK